MLKRVPLFFSITNIFVDLFLISWLVIMSTYHMSFSTYIFRITYTVLLWIGVNSIYNIYFLSYINGKVTFLLKNFQFLVAFSLLYFTLKSYKTDWFIAYDFDTLLFRLWFLFPIWKTLFFLVRRYVVIKHNRQSAILLGKEKNSLEVYKVLKKDKNHCVDPKGFVHITDPSSLDTICEDLLSTKEFGQVDWLYISSTSFETTVLNSIVSFCELHHQKVRIITDIKSVYQRNTSFEHHDYIPIITVNYTPLDLNIFTAFYKRVFDVSFSLGLVVLGFPLWLFTALMIKFTSKGPIFYKQERVGLNRKSFLVYKFRSMAVREQDAETFSSDRNDEMYVTSWGKFIRKYRIDEVPQILNVLKGDMSVVGPRALAKYEVDQMLEQYPQFSRVFSVKPGVTSLGQIRYGRAKTLQETYQRMRIDVLYHTNISLILDFKILYLTVGVVLRGEGE